MRIKVKELAGLMNLSPSTVSLVLNNKPGISEATRNRVKKAVRELGYEELIIDKKEEKKSYLFIIHRKTTEETEDSLYFSQFFSEIIEGVESQIKARGYNLMISYMDGKTTREEVVEYCKGNPEGILILATDLEEDQISIFDHCNVPLVIIDNYLENKKINCITINNEKGVYEAVKYLVDMGHKRIGYLHIANHTKNFKERYFGYKRAAELCGLYIESEDIIDISAKGSEPVYRELKKNFEGKEKLPTAFFSDNDVVALCAVKALKELGYRVPDDISIVGFDNIAFAEMTDPPLTTVQIPKYLLGVIAANTIVDMKKALIGLTKIEVGTDLVIRSSVKKL